MTVGIEFYYHTSPPFWELNSEYWRRAEASGNANICFANSEIVRELTPLYPLHTYNFIKVINRTNKTLIRVDIGGVAHQNENDISNDGLNIRNQEGPGRETYDAPPFGIAPLWYPIERYKKEHKVMTGNQKEDYGSNNASFFGSSLPTRDMARAVRIWYQQNRIGDASNPGGHSLSVHEYMPNFGDWPRVLEMSPDQDYPDGNLFENGEFNGSTYQPYPTSWPGLYWPEKWIIESNIPSQNSNSTYVPSHQKYFPYPYLGLGVWENTVKIATGNDLDYPSQNLALWDSHGIYQKWQGTQPWAREANNKPRCRHMFTSFSGVTINDSDSRGNVTDNVTNQVFDLQEDYFWNVAYSNRSTQSYQLWETNRTVDGTWFFFDSDGTINYNQNVGASIRHTLGDPANDPAYKQHFSRYTVRWRQAVDNNWSDWNQIANSILVPEDSPVITLPVWSVQAASANPTSKVQYQVQMGNVGGRGKAYKVKFTKSNPSASFIRHIADSNIYNRRIYKGDIFQYEVLLDESSVDGNFYIDLEIASNKVESDSNNDIISNYVTIAVPTRRNMWEKVQVDLSQFEGMYIRKVVFKFFSSNANTGSCLCYFNEVQILNQMTRWLGRQFLFSARLATKNITAASFTNDAHKPAVRFYMRCIDQTGLEYYSLTTMRVSVDNLLSWTGGVQGGLDADNPWFWIRSIIQIPYDPNCVEIGIGLFVYRKLSNPDGSIWFGPNSGGELHIERMWLEPTSRMYFMGSYSTDNAPSQGDAFGGNNFIQVDTFGWKAWALQLRSRYFQEW